MIFNFKMISKNYSSRELVLDSGIFWVAHNNLIVLLRGLNMILCLTPIHEFVFTNQNSIVYKVGFLGLLLLYFFLH